MLELHAKIDQSVQGNEFLERWLERIRGPRGENWKARTMRFLLLKQHEVKISTHGKGQWVANEFVEQL